MENGAPEIIFYIPAKAGPLASETRLFHHASTGLLS